MKYQCLVYIEEKDQDALPKGELDALVRESLAYYEELRRRARAGGPVLCGRAGPGRLGELVG
jgi:hypothetical protein